MCSETRAAHKLSVKLNRDIIIGGTTLDTPSEFLEHLKVRPGTVCWMGKRLACCLAPAMPLHRLSAALPVHRSWEWDQSTQPWK